jgi:fluoride exporter
MMWMFVALAGALGSACRYALDRSITARSGDRFPWGTVIVNVSGSFGAGIVGGLAATRVLPAALSLVILGGFLGAYTTFSTATFQTVQLWEQGRRSASIVNLVTPLVLATAAAVLGWSLTGR